jgi:hypothetical protein
MKTLLLVPLVLFFLVSCSSTPVNQALDRETIIYQDEDLEILEQIFARFAGEKEAPTSELMLKVGTYFRETPYVAHTLEKENEQLVINLRELDCTTFAENCLAITRTIRSGNPDFDQFCSELQLIRYRDGKMEGYPSRLHYFCDWIHNNQQKKLVKDMSEELAQTPLSKEINFMSTHPDSYQQLEKDTALINDIAAQEKRISAREMFYIPESRIASLEDRLQDGDIAGITCNIDGIAIMHVVILIRQEGRIHILHASSKAEKVVVSENTLEDYLLNSKSATGIMLARPV